VDVRFVASTNRELKESIARGAFRQDLFYRLDGVSVRIPPLRERPSEIAALARVFAEQASFQNGRGPVALSDATLTTLVRHTWPGNARELRNVVARAVMLCPGDVVEPDQLHFEAIGGRSSAPPPAPSAPVATFDVSDREPGPPDAARVVEALDQCAGNQTRAAKLLGISRSTLVRWLDQMGTRRPRK
jgi:DNA-binding NtrC family response regulator